MLAPNPLMTQLPLKLDVRQSHTGIGSVFAAAVVSRSFCQMLLTDPERALRQGYMGKGFDLSPEDETLIASINARSLPELAKQVVHTLSL